MEFTLTLDSMGVWVNIDASNMDVGRIEYLFDQVRENGYPDRV